MSNLQLLSFHNWLVDLRRELHQIPEPGYKEEKTAAKICRVLDELGIPYQTGVGKTGVVAGSSLKRQVRWWPFGRTWMPCRWRNPMMSPISRGIRGLCMPAGMTGM